MNDDAGTGAAPGASIIPRVSIITVTFGTGPIVFDMLDGPQEPPPIIVHIDL